MRVFDAHCDTATQIIEKNCGLYSNNLDNDIERMLKYDEYTQVFAVFHDPKKTENVKKATEAAINNFYSEIEKNKKHIGVAKTSEERKKLLSGGKIAAILSIEGGECIENESDVEWLWDKGVRMMSLTWNYDNHLAGGAHGEGEVTKEGRAVLKEMERMGMILDVSHANEKSFWQMCDIFGGKICASHSNLRSICDNPRNLTDDQFKELVKRGGAVGINLYPPFLGENADFNTVLRHMEKAMALGGENTLGMGCDFDGVDGNLPEGINGSENLFALYQSAEKAFSRAVAEKIFHLNFENFFSYY